MLEIPKAKALRGEPTLPGDKSISHRAVILGSMANGITLVRNFLSSLDCLSTVDCLRSLGIQLDLTQNGEATVSGNGKEGFSPPDKVLFAGNSATTVRLLAGALSSEKFTCTLDGDASLRRRPMRRIIEPLSIMGARIQAREAQFPPLTITGAELGGIAYRLPVASAQVKSAILLAGLRAIGATRIYEGVPTRDHTERMLRAMGASLSEENSWIVLEEGAQLRGIEVDVPGDFSSAAFLIAGALILSGSEILLKNVNINPRRTGLMGALRRMGAEIRIDTAERIGAGTEETLSHEPVGNIHVRASTLTGTIVEGDEIVSLIDEIPILALAATQAEGETIIRGAGELRNKETDRIKATVLALRALGAETDELEDGLAIKGPSLLSGATLTSQGDHRIAMMIAIAGLISRGRTQIMDSDCIDVSFPGFANTLQALAA